MRTLRAGLIGCGGISETHLQAIRKTEGVALAAFCDVERARAERLASLWGGGEVYTDFREMLARGGLDAVHIATPHHLHARMCLDALEAGVYALCEKPMAIREADARALIRADTLGRLCFVFQNRYNRATVLARQTLASKTLGAFVTARATVTWARGADYYASADWRGKWATEGGGTLINQAIHTVDLLGYLCGPFEQIKGSVSTDGLQGAIEVEDNCHAVIRFAGGQTGLLHTSNNFGITEPPQILIYCEKGLLTLTGDSLRVTRDGETRALHDAQAAPTVGKAVYGNSHELQIADFYDSVRRGAATPLGAREAYPAVWAVLGIYASSKTDRWVRFAD